MASLRRSWNAAIEDGLIERNLQRGARGEGAARDRRALSLVRPGNGIQPVRPDNVGQAITVVVGGRCNGITIQFGGDAEAINLGDRCTVQKPIAPMLIVSGGPDKVIAAVAIEIASAADTPAGWIGRHIR